MLLRHRAPPRATTGERCSPEPDCLPGVREHGGRAAFKVRRRQSGGGPVPGPLTFLCSLGSRSEGRLYTAGQPPSQVLGPSKAGTSPRRRPYAPGPCAALELRSLNRRRPPSGGLLGGAYSAPYTDLGLLEPQILLSPPPTAVQSRAREVPIRDLPALGSSLWVGGWYEIVCSGCRQPGPKGPGFWRLR